jgi:hypothetical protein
MTLDEFIAVIRGYTGFLDPEVQTDTYLTAFIRQGERKTSNELRIADMIQIDTATLFQRRVTLPSDWLATDFVRGPDGKPLRFKARQEFYELNDGRKYFTQTGRWIEIGGDPDAVDGKSIELSYFGDVPALTNDAMNPSWLANKYLEVLVSGTMFFAMDAMVDPSVPWGDRFTSAVAKLNSNYIESLTKGGTIARRTGSFG